MKKFYKLVSHRPEAEGFAILLDDKPVKTRGRASLIAPNKKLADAIVREWAGQGDLIDAGSMPLTQLLNTKIDRVAGGRAALEKEVLKYLNTDLLCYHAPAPEELAARQKEIWTPWLDWFEKRFGCALQTTTDLGALNQNEDVHAIVRNYIQKRHPGEGRDLGDTRQPDSGLRRNDAGGMNDDAFTILQLVTPLSGSFVLALAFTERAATPDDLMKAAFLEEDFKAELCNEAEYGADPHIKTRKNAAQRDLDAARIYLESF